MNVFPAWWDEHRAQYMNAELPEEGLFARIEGLVGQEDALLRIPAQQRTEAHHERLRSIAHELDLVWEKLRERAERAAGEHKPAGGEAG
ncbi:MAG: hypothetical protein QOJ57_1463 [Thermoleophilaceae bacterium]|jgi:hypothetical protein|nr:hypothetical protein [Thermoleophilaceae bacterium]